MSGAWRAFVVCISKYDHHSHLPGALIDAHRGPDILRRIGFDTTCSLGRSEEGYVTADELEQDLDAFLTAVEKDVGSVHAPVLFFLFSTHGLQAGDQEFPSLLASDSEKDANHGYDVQEKVVMRLNKMRARDNSSVRSNMVFETCRENAGDVTWRARARAFPSLRNDFYFLFACDRGRLARDTATGGPLVLVLSTLLMVAEPITRIFEETAQAVAQFYEQRPWTQSRVGQQIPVLGAWPRSDVPAFLPFSMPMVCKSSAGAEPTTVVLVGPTGHGKSTLGNALAGCSAFDARDDFTSVTKVPQHIDADYASEPYPHWRIIDTVGFHDTAMSTEEHVAQFRAFAERAPWGVDAFVLVMRKERFTQHHLDMLRAFSEAVGATALERTILAFSWAGQLCDDACLESTLTQQNNPHLCTAISQVAAVVAIDSGCDKGRTASGQRVREAVVRLVTKKGGARFSNNELVLARWRLQDLRRLADGLRGERQAWLEAKIADVVEGRESSEKVTVAAYNAVRAQEKEDTQQRELAKLRQEEMEREEQRRQEAAAPKWRRIGEDQISSKGLMGTKRDFHYDVPTGTQQVSLESEDRSQSGLNLGAGRVLCLEVFILPNR
eukprot:TRINITY_DN40988_c0_g1_i1.p1 TRINITY_DN40988_c0_g1~~TRINITY_DN40988_c0_g1_i1.p1  ORF type:complete len:609 (+),score=80.18 TRINITY_DN40988_c0_g1_i1:106-1932(+)